MTPQKQSIAMQNQLNQKDQQDQQSQQNQQSNLQNNQQSNLLTQQDTSKISSNFNEFSEFILASSAEHLEHLLSLFSEFMEKKISPLNDIISKHEEVLQGLREENNSLKNEIAQSGIALNEMKIHVKKVEQENFNLRLQLQQEQMTSARNKTLLMNSLRQNQPPPSYKLSPTAHPSMHPTPIQISNVASVANVSSNIGPNSGTTPSNLQNVQNINANIVTNTHSNAHSGAILYNSGKPNSDYYNSDINAIRAAAQVLNFDQKQNYQRISHSRSSSIDNTYPVRSSSPHRNLQSHPTPQGTINPNSQISNPYMGSQVTIPVSSSFIASHNAGPMNSQSHNSGHMHNTQVFHIQGPLQGTTQGHSQGHQSHSQVLQQSIQNQVRNNISNSGMSHPIQPNTISVGVSQSNSSQNQNLAQNSAPLIHQRVSQKLSQESPQKSPPRSPPKSPRSSPNSENPTTQQTTPDRNSPHHRQRPQTAAAYVNSPYAQADMERYSKIEVGSKEYHRLNEYEQKLVQKHSEQNTTEVLEEVFSRKVQHPDERYLPTPTVLPLQSSPSKEPSVVPPRAKTRPSTPNRLRSSSSVGSNITKTNNRRSVNYGRSSPMRSSSSRRASFGGLNAGIRLKESSSSFTEAPPNTNGRRHSVSTGKQREFSPTSTSSSASFNSFQFSEPLSPTSVKSNASKSFPLSQYFFSPSSTHLDLDLGSSNRSIRLKRNNVWRSSLGNSCFSNEGIHQFSIFIEETSGGHPIRIGIADYDFDLSIACGSSPLSYAIDTSTGNVFHSRNEKNYYSGRISKNSIVTVILDLDNLQLSFQLNGENLGTAWTLKKNVKYFPCVSLSQKGSCIRFV